jgi:hypothetical protein
MMIILLCILLYNRIYIINIYIKKIELKFGRNGIKSTKREGGVKLYCNVFFVGKAGRKRSTLYCILVTRLI